MDAMLKLFEATTDGVCAVDHAQRIVLWNRAAERLLGYSAREVEGRRCFEVLHGTAEGGQEFCQRHCPLFGLAERGEVVPSVNLRARTRDGRDLWLNVSTMPLPLSWRRHATLIHLFRDVSHAKECEDAVERLLLQLQPDGAGSPGVQPATPSAPDACLTRRECEVLRLLAAGATTRDIAATLSVSVSTVRNHIHHLLDKLDAHSRLEAVATATRMGWL